MATHRIELTNIFDYKRLGNSISTIHQFDGVTYTVEWKGEVQQFKARSGDFFLVKTYGGVPDVIKMKVPHDPVLRALWENGCTQSKRVRSLEALESMHDTRWSSPHGHSIPNTFINITECGNLAALLRGNDYGNFFPVAWYMKDKSQLTVEQVNSVTEKESLGSFYVPSSPTFVVRSNGDVLSKEKFDRVVLEEKVGMTSEEIERVKRYALNGCKWFLEGGRNSYNSTLELDGWAVTVTVYGADYRKDPKGLFAGAILNPLKNEPHQEYGTFYSKYPLKVGIEEHYRTFYDRSEAVAEVERIKKIVEEVYADEIAASRAKLERLIVAGVIAADLS